MSTSTTAERDRQETAGREPRVADAGAALLGTLAGSAAVIGFVALFLLAIALGLSVAIDFLSELPPPT